MVSVLVSPETNYFSNATGLPLAFGTINYYIPGTTTPKNIYIDPAGTTVAPNPYTLDAFGRGLVYGEGQYRQVLYDSLGNLQLDQVTSSFDYGISVTSLGISLTSLGISSTILPFVQGSTLPVLIGSTNNQGRLLGVKVFTASGTYTPTTGMVSIIVEAQGGGGAGGGCPATAALQGSTAGGGAAGAYGRSRYLATQLGTTVAVTIGAGGVNSGAGGSTTFGAALLAYGGPGAGTGVATGGSLLAGGALQSSPPTGANIFGVFGNCGGYGIVLNASTALYALSGSGGASYLGSGGSNTGGPGTVGNSGTYGGGGSGTANAASSAANTGGPGGSGVVIIYEYA